MLCELLCYTIVKFIKGILWTFMDNIHLVFKFNFSIMLIMPFLNKFLHIMLFSLEIISFVIFTVNKTSN